MGKLLGIGLALGIAFVCAVAFRHTRLRRMARERLNEDVQVARTERALGLTPSLRRRPWLPLVAGLAVSLLLHFWIGLGGVYAVALGVIVGVSVFLFEGWRQQRNRLRLEMQLANAIDLMVASLGAGSGLMDAIEGAAHEAGKPLKPELQETLGRIRFGENPKQVFEDLAARVPLEAFRLFAFTMAVHGETGGSLAPTLASVGRTIRDRIEIGRRVRSQSTQAQASVVGIVLITYFLGALMWRTNPAGFEEFLSHPVGANVLAAAIVLQALGLLWITRLTQLRF
ncbi:MAG: type II secretion system F family protein [Planctomycetes bacterium]|nr:type II secretion system F family protein [Planctomycetota bacterium]